MSVVRITLFILSFLYTVQAVANNNNIVTNNNTFTESSKLSKELNLLSQTVIKDPQAVKTQLLKLPIEHLKSSPEKYLKWFVIKAESENYLYHFDEFKKSVDQGLSLIKKHSPSQFSSIDIAKIWILDGIRNQKGGAYKAAMLSLQKGIDIANENQHTYTAIYGLVELAYTRSLAEQFEIALLELQEAYLMAKELEQVFLIGFVEETYGVLYGYMQKYQESIKHYNKAYELYTQLEYPYYIGESIYGIATTYRYSNNSEQAIIWYNKYLNALPKLDNQYIQFFYHYGVGMTSAEAGDCEQALPSIRQALLIEEYIDYNAELYKQLAICQAKSGEFNAAESSLNKAKAIYKKMPILKGTTWEVEVLKISAEIEQLKGNHQKAFLLIDAYYQAYIKSQQKNLSERVEKLLVTLQTEREKRELIALENQSQLQQLELKNQTKKIEIQRLWLYVTILLVLIGFGFTWWQFKMAKKLKSLAITDDLTGLTNRRYIFTTIESVLANKFSKQKYHSLMLIDVDNLKPINDEFGHQIGDRVLKKVADVGRQILRDSDVFARIGGDEYMLFLTRANRNLADTVANRIVESLSHANFVSNIGIVTTDAQDITPEALYSRVDEALYAAKSNGRNCVYHWEPNPILNNTKLK